MFPTQEIHVQNPKPNSVLNPYRMLFPPTNANAKQTIPKLVTPLSRSPILTIDMYNFVCMIWMATLDNNGCQSSAFQASCVDSHAVFANLKASFRIVSIDNCGSVVLWEVLLIFVPDLLFINTRGNNVRFHGLTYLHPCSPISYITRDALLRNGSHIHRHHWILFLQLHTRSQTSVDNHNLAHRAKLSHPKNNRAFF